VTSEGIITLSQESECINSCVRDEAVQLGGDPKVELYAVLAFIYAFEELEFWTMKENGEEVLMAENGLNTPFSISEPVDGCW